MRGERLIMDAEGTGLVVDRNERFVLIREKKKRNWVGVHLWPDGSCTRADVDLTIATRMSQDEARRLLRIKHRAWDDRGNPIEAGDTIMHVATWPPHICTSHGAYTVKEITNTGTVVVDVGGYVDYEKRIPGYLITRCTRILRKKGR